MATDFTLPELGENVTSGDVLRVLVKPGDTLVKDQPVLELETDKATIEVPSPIAGEIAEVRVKAGDTVKVGQSILSVVESGGAPAEKPEPPAAAAQPAAAAAEHTATSNVTPEPAAPPPAAEAAESSEAADTSDDVDERNRPAEPAPRKASAPPDKAEAKERRAQKVVDISRGARPTGEPPAPSDQPLAPAAPSVRRMARELGVNINDVAGSGTRGRISIDDVKAHVNRLVTSVPAAGGTAVEPLPDFSRWGDVERRPMRGVRRKTAQHLASAWASIPHVTQHERADVTALDELRKRYAKSVEAAGGNLTVTSMLVKIVAAALRKFPQVNSSVDMAAEELVLKSYVNIGIAVDTEHGLLVPVIRDADNKSITQISVELTQLSEKARSRKLSLDEMQGGTFSISNLGGIGGTTFTPIVNAPEVAILGVSRARLEPVYNDAGDLVPRLILPLSLSYDHRVVDGAEGLRFLRWIVDALEQPFLLLLLG